MKQDDSQSERPPRSRKSNGAAKSNPAIESTLAPAAAAGEGVYPWEEPTVFPAGGLSRRELVPVVAEAYLQSVAQHAWTVMGHHWETNERAFQELSSVQPEGCEAVARFIAGQFLKGMPETGIAEERLWDDFCNFNLRAYHDYAEDDGFKAYLRHRIGKPGLMQFLQRAVENFSAKETPDIGGRMVFGIYWDLFILPLRFWSDEASAELFTVSGIAFNLDKVRNTRRELGLKRSQPVIVKRFKRMPPTSPGASGQIDVQLDDKAAERLGVPGMLEALIQYFKSLPPSGRKPA